MQQWGAGRCRAPRRRELRKVIRGVGELVRGRNDFVHAVFLLHATFAAPAMRPPPRVMATRVRSGTKKPAEELAKVRDRAAKVSRMMAHVDWLVHGKASPSPWQGSS